MLCTSCTLLCTMPVLVALAVVAKRASGVVVLRQPPPLPLLVVVVEAVLRPEVTPCRLPAVSGRSVAECRAVLAPSLLLCRWRGGRPACRQRVWRRCAVPSLTTACCSRLWTLQRTRPRPTCTPCLLATAGSAPLCSAALQTSWRQPVAMLQLQPCCARSQYAEGGFIIRRRHRHWRRSCALAQPCCRLCN